MNKTKIIAMGKRLWKKDFGWIEITNQINKKFKTNLHHAAVNSWVVNSKGGDRFRTNTKTRKTPVELSFPKKIGESRMPWIVVIVQSNLSAEEKIKMIKEIIT
jgi:hypothetical protein